MAHVYLAFFSAQSKAVSNSHSSLSEAVTGNNPPSQAPSQQVIIVDTVTGKVVGNWVETLVGLESPIVPTFLEWLEYSADIEFR